jgi:inner membrane protein
LFLATASHGVLDAMTNGGLGVAFFSPFDNRVIPAVETRSRFTNRHYALFTPRGLAILQSELLWIWFPAILLASLVWMLRRKSQPDVAMPNE